MSHTNLFPAISNHNLASLYQESKVDTQQRPEGVQYLQFKAKIGEFKLGKENEDVTDEQVLINPASFKHGWTLWVAGKCNKIDAYFYEPLPTPMKAVDTGDGKPPIMPSQSRSFECFFLDDVETAIAFDTNTHGGRQACDDIYEQVKQRLIDGEQDYLYPLIELNCGQSYVNSYGTTYNPTFKVVAWYNAEGYKEGDPIVINAEQQTVQEKIIEQKEETPSLRRRRKPRA